jgi:hypothetical protein
MEDLIDLTVIFLTVNKVPEKWAEYHRQVLTKSIGSYPIITISRIPMDWGTNLIQDTISADNIYRQLLRGAKLATTPFIAVAEDDTLYPREHFTEFRPPMDTFAYDTHRWGIFTWSKPPTYFLASRFINASLIAPRELTVEALEERFAMHPDKMPDNKVGELGRSKIEHRLGVSLRKSVEFVASQPTVYFGHDYALDPLEQSHRKAPGKIRAYDLPYWGRADKLIGRFV